jgi:predicted membrane protein
MNEYTKQHGDSEQAYNKHDKRLWFGLFLVIIGGAWLLDNLNVLNFLPGFLISWKTFLIGLGLYLIFGPKQKGTGLILIAVGGIFLLDDFDVVDIRNFWHLIWPAVIIIIGIGLIARRRTSNVDTSATAGYDVIDDVSVFGGGEKVVNSQNFQGGRITAVFGGSEIDFRNAELAEGKHVLDVFCMFGGSSIIVPPNWHVQMDVTAVLGGASDNRKSVLQVVPDQNKTLIVKGFAMFGGVEVKYSK